jgi:hypothetical protein
VSEITGKLDDLTTLADDIPSGAAPGAHSPSVPPSLTEPTMPHVPEAPRLPETTTPHDLPDPAAGHSATPEPEGSRPPITAEGPQNTNPSLPGDTPPTPGADGSATVHHDHPGAHTPEVVEHPPGHESSSGLDGQHPAHVSPQPLPSDSPIFNEYEMVDPGPEYTNPDGSLIYPDDSLPEKPYAIPGTVVPDAHLEPGTVIDRFGYPGGGWLSPEGTPFLERALPPDSAMKPYFTYEVADPSQLPPGWRIEQSNVAPWFHQPGGGVQYRIVAPEGERPSVQTLLDWGYLREADR